MSKLAKILVFLVAAASGCSKPAKPTPYYIDRLQLSESTVQRNPALAMSGDDLRVEAEAAFSRSRRFVLLAATTKPRPADLKALRCRVELAFTRETLEEDGTSRAEIGAVLELRRPGEVDRYQATGLGRARFLATDHAARVPSFRKALAEALDEAVKSGALHLDALSKTDAELIADLSSPDPRLRDYAVQVLADRKNAAAVPALMERLKDSDREVAMRAVGALGAIGDPRAVSALIEMGQTRDPQFVIALISVVAQLGGRDAEAFLFTLASGHPEEAVRRAAQEAEERLKSADAGHDGEAQPRSP
ncbi:MAG: HEAT repeat domain-containing protein [Deltaproteobacteria bacterium]|nr:HEAT repeat domain-containing protein [Deltaproteobacteria bacterium]